MYCSKCGALMDPSETYCRACGTPAVALNLVPVAGQGIVSGAAAYVVPVSIYAGFWLRLVAYLIDSVVTVVPMVILALVILVFDGSVAILSRAARDGDVPPAVGVLVAATFIGIFVTTIVVRWLYYAYSESSHWQATLGKRALGIYVTDAEGNRVTFARASGRFFAATISRLIPLWIGFIMAGFTARKQALHDMIASCLVLRRQAVAAWVTPPQPTNEAL